MIMEQVRVVATTRMDVVEDVRFSRDTVFHVIEGNIIYNK